MNAAEQDIADGFVTKVKDWRRETGWADVVVFDDVLGNMGAMADEVRAAGRPAAKPYVLGGSPYTDRLEEDRAFGQQELKAAGVSIIPQENFTSFDDAVAYVQANPTRYVIKPSGEAQNDKRLLFVGEEEDGRDVIGVLHDYKKYQAHRVKEFQLRPAGRVGKMMLAISGHPEHGIACKLVHRLAPRPKSWPASDASGAGLSAS